MATYLQDKIALVTGAGRGIGRACAELLAARGCRVVLVSRTLSQLEDVAKGIKAKGFKSLACCADISQEDEVEGLFRRVKEVWGSVDILVNNAGVFERGEISDLSVAQWDQVMGVNVRGTFLCSRQVFRDCRAESKPASIVNIASLAGIRGTEKFPGLASYVTSKFAVVGLTESLAVEGRPLGIRVNCLAPGAVDTEMLRQALPLLKTKTKPAQIAQTVLHLADSSESPHLNGAVIEIFSNL